MNLSPVRSFQSLINDRAGAVTCNMHHVQTTRQGTLESVSCGALLDIKAFEAHEVNGSYEITSDDVSVHCFEAPCLFMECVREFFNFGNLLFMKIKTIKSWHSFKSEHLCYNDPQNCTVLPRF